tara:strand:+ start:1234 stop:2718 length:1485 start_codon:yes stop_codon:yes gene_type:complete
MALIPLKLPPGVHRNGTDFESSNRWRDASLVRWHDGTLRPVGGWVTRKASAFAYAPRAMLSYLDNNSDEHLVAGTYEKLYYVNPSQTVYDITPTSGFTSGTLSGAINTGYGGGFYGRTNWGNAPQSSGIYSEATTWSLDTWGEYLLAVSSTDGKLLEWQGNTGVKAQTVSNAPTSNNAMVVSEERFVFCLGAGGNPRKVAWSDQENNTVWTASATNQAGDFELQTTGQIMCGLRMRGRTLILTDNDAHIATYSGAPFVYGFERVGTACGVASRKGAVAIDEGAFWMGKKGFFSFDGSVASQISCEVADYVFDDMNQAQKSKVYAIHNSQYGEIWWFYPSANSNENDRYVTLDYKEGHWAIGNISRTAGVDQGIFTSPIWGDASGNLYNQETGYTHTGSSKPFAESGAISIGNGDSIMKVTQLIPDEGTQGQVQVTFKTRFHPNDTETSHGAVTLTNPTDVRFQGRQVRMKVQGVGNDNWRSGVMRIEVAPGGRR